MTDTTTTTETTRSAGSARRTRGRTIRLVVFRVLMGLVALLHLIGFGAWQAILAPWVVFPDGADHGWDRTPELHRLADGAAGAIFLAIAAAAIVLVVRPVGRAGLAAWLAGAIALTGGFAWLSSTVQGHGADEVLSNAIVSAVWVVAVAAIFVWLHPEGRDILHGGASDASASRPAGALRFVLIAVGVAGFVGAVVAVVWRALGGLFESPQEDDVFSLVYFCALWALGAFVAAGGRAGWRPLTMVVLAGAAYAVVGGVSVAVAA